MYGWEEEGASVALSEGIVRTEGIGGKLAAGLSEGMIYVCICVSVCVYMYLSE